MKALSKDVLSTRAECDRLLLLVPDKRYSECNEIGRKAYDVFSAALESHRRAVRAARAIVGRAK